MLAALLSALFASCKDETEEVDEYVPSSRNDGMIGFAPDFDGFQKPTTRLTNSITNISNVFVFSKKRKDAEWENVFNDATGKSIEVLTLNRNGITSNGEIWDYAPVAEWNTNYNYSFSAYYPQNMPGKKTDPTLQSCDRFKLNAPNGVSINLEFENYRSAQNPKSNTDILVSGTIDRPYSIDANSDPISLKMKHLFACVDFKFRTDKKAVHVTSLKVKGYTREGNCVVYQSPIWTPKWTPTPGAGTTETVVLSINENSAEKFIFKDKYSDLVISPKDMEDYVLDYKSRYGKFYAISLDEYNASSTNLGTYAINGTKDETQVYDNNAAYKELLFIPQELEREGIFFNIDFKLKDWGNQVRKVEDVPLKHVVFAEIEYYFDDDPSHPLVATIDLTANGKVHEWAGNTRYTYIIGIYEHHVMANITVEDWTHNIYEDNLK